MDRSGHLSFLDGSGLHRVNRTFLYDLQAHPKLRFGGVRRFVDWSDLHVDPRQESERLTWL
jgi:hypothetical protein